MPVPHATNCSIKTGYGSHDGTGTKAPSKAASAVECCTLCFESTTCVLASWVERDGGCFLHTSVARLRSATGVDVAITGRVPTLAAD